jgi:hypothetical protein
MLICILLAYRDQPFSIYYWSSHRITNCELVVCRLLLRWLAVSSLSSLGTQSLVPAVLSFLPSGNLMDGSCVWMGLVMCVCVRERERESMCVWEFFSWWNFVNKWNQKLKFWKRSDLSIQVVIKKKIHNQLVIYQSLNTNTSFLNRFKLIIFKFIF